MALHSTWPDRALLLKFRLSIQGRQKQFHSGQAIPKKQEHEINGITLPSYHNIEIFAYSYCTINHLKISTHVGYQISP